MSSYAHTHNVGVYITTAPTYSIQSHPGYAHGILTCGMKRLILKHAYNTYHNYVMVQYFVWEVKNGKTLSLENSVSMPTLSLGLVDCTSLCSCPMLCNAWQSNLPKNAILKIRLFITTIV